MVRSTEGHPRGLKLTSFDLVVIGSGPAGQKAAIAAAKIRKRVAVIDRQTTLGGVSVHNGTIPSKTFREGVLYLTGFRERTFYGRSYSLKERISAQDLSFRVRAVVAKEIEIIPRATDAQRCGGAGRRGAIRGSAHPGNSGDRRADHSSRPAHCDRVRHAPLAQS